MDQVNPDGEHQAAVKFFEYEASMSHHHLQPASMRARPAGRTDVEPFAPAKLVRHLLLMSRAYVVEIVRIELGNCGLGEDLALRRGRLIGSGKGRS